MIFVDTIAEEMRQSTTTFFRKASARLYCRLCLFIYRFAEFFSFGVLLNCLEIFSLPDL